MQDQFYFTKYSSNDNSKTNRTRFRSFQATLYGNIDKMNEIEQMYNNYNLFNNCGIKQRRTSLKEAENSQSKRHKNNKERQKDNKKLKLRLQEMKNQRKNLFQKLHLLGPVKLPVKN